MEEVGFQGSRLVAKGETERSSEATKASPRTLGIIEAETSASRVAFQSRVTLSNVRGSHAALQRLTMGRIAVKYPIVWRFERIVFLKETSCRKGWNRPRGEMIARTKSGALALERFATIFSTVP